MSFIDIINEQVNIIDAIELYTGAKLRRNSRGYGGACPFHQDGSPSFYTRNDTNKAICYAGCNHGKPMDVVNVVMLARGITYKEAIKLLKVDFNLDLDNKSPTSRKTYFQELEVRRQYKERIINKLTYIYTRINDINKIVNEYGVPIENCHVVFTDLEALHTEKEQLEQLEEMLNNEKISLGIIEKTMKEMFKRK